MSSVVYREHGDYHCDERRVIVRCQSRKLDDKKDPVWCNEAIVVDFPGDSGRKEGLCPKCRFPLLVTSSKEYGIRVYTAIC